MEFAAERSDRGQGGTVRATPRLSLTPKTAARNKKGVDDQEHSRTAVNVRFLYYLS